MFTGYQGDATAIDAFLVVVDSYAVGMAQALAGGSNRLGDSYVHALTTMAEQLLDTEGRMKLIPRANGALSAPTDKVTITCRTCGGPKDAEQFNRDAKNKITGRKTQCKDCESKQRSRKKAAAA